MLRQVTREDYCAFIQSRPDLRDHATNGENISVIQVLDENDTLVAQTIYGSPDRVYTGRTKIIPLYFIT